MNLEQFLLYYFDSLSRVSTRHFSLTVCLHAFVKLERPIYLMLFLSQQSLFYVSRQAFHVLITERLFFCSTDYNPALMPARPLGGAADA